MNRIYRLVWNRNRHVWMAVAENSRGRSKSGLSRKLLARVLALVGGALLAPLAIAAPVGGQVSAGIGSIAQAGANTTITQSSQNLAINWQGFSIAANEGVRFNQPNASAIALNRVLGQDPSRILGSLSANGQVFVLNPNGVLFGATAQVNVGGLVASTLSISDADFMAGKHSFGNGGAAGSVLNQGTLTAANGGYIALLAPDVRNEGVISATLGTALLAAGDKVTLTLNNGSLLAYRIDQGSLNALAENKHLIQADGGQVFMSAKAANALTTAMVNNTGIIEARTVQNVAGVIMLMGDMQVGTVNVGGTLDASAPNGGNGGFIETSAAHVNIANDAKVTTASSMGLSGTWLIDPVDFTIAATGGNMTGATLSTNLANNAVVSILSINGTTGTAGDVNVNDVVTWSANQLVLNAHNNININANLNASGTASLALVYGQGAVALNNTSNIITANGAAVNLPAGTTNFTTLQGSNGVVKNYTVITSLGAAGSMTTTDLQGMSGSLASNYALGSDIDAVATSTGPFGTTGFAPINYFTGTFDGLGHTISNLTINRPTTDFVGLFGIAGTVSTIRNVGLVGGSVTGKGIVGGLVGYNYAGSSISNSYATGSVTGTTGVGGLVGQNGYGSSISNSYATGSVTGTTGVGGLVGVNHESINNSYATGAVTGTKDVGGLVGFTDYLDTVSNSYYNIDTVMINGVKSHVTPYGLYNAQYQDWFSDKVLSITSYTSTLSPGSGLDNGYYLISSVQGLKDLLGFADNTSYKFRLTANLDLATVRGDLDATTISGWYIPYFAGSEFDGGGYVLDKLVVNPLMNRRIGFIGMLASGSLLGNIGLTNVSVTGSDYVGGLVGVSYGSINNSYASGSVTGQNFVGGLVGLGNINININNSYATASVTGGTYTGGLVGYNPGGTVSNSYAMGNVSGVNYVGGLVGFNGLSGSPQTNSTVSNSYATGNVIVTGGGIVGGLVGYNVYSTVSNSYATGNVIVTGSGFAVGGLVGYNVVGTVSNSYATGNVIVTGSGSVGGLVGESYYSPVSNSFARGNVSVSGANSSVGGLVGLTSSTVSNSYAIGSVSGSGSVGGLVGSSSSSVTGSYATGSVSGSGTYSMVGGLVGRSSGSVTGSYATGSVSGSGVDSMVGGLVGASSSVTGSYATGSVSQSAGGYSVGGLVGSSGIVNTSYATGNVSGPNIAGGLVGDSYGAVSISYATGNVSGGNYVGGLVGENYGQITNAYATGNVSGADSVGGLVGINYDTVSNAYATGTVIGTSSVGGLIGDNDWEVSNSFWDTQTSGQPTTGIGAGLDEGATGRTTAEMRSVATFSSVGWNIANTGGSGLTWRVYEGSATPWLMWWLDPLTVTANSDSKLYDGAPYSGGNGVTYSFAPDGSLLYGSADFRGTSQGAINVGSYAITSGVYSVQQGYDISSVDGTLTIDKAHLTVTADDKTRLYGAANPTLTSTVSGFVNGETANNAAGYSGAANITTLANATTNVGTALITGATGNLAATNYDFAAANGTLTINPAEIITPPVGGILPAVVDAITVLPGGADLLPAFSSTVTVAATQIDAVAPPPALANLQYVYVTRTTPGNLSGDIDTTVDGEAVPTKAQGSKSDGFNERLSDAPIQFTGTVLVRNGGIRLPGDADDANARAKK